MATVLVNECEPFTLFDLGLECNIIKLPSTSTSTDGILGLIITGGTSPYTIVWDNGTVGPILSGASAGEYGVTVTDYSWPGGGPDYTARTICYLYAPTPTPTVTPTLTQTPTPTPVYPNLCFIIKYPLDIVGPLQFVPSGTTNGRTTWIYTSGSTTYSVQWMPFEGRWEMSGYSYNGGSLVSYDSGYIPTANWQEEGATNDATIVVTEGLCPAYIPLITSVQKMNSSCQGPVNCNGSIVIVANGGIPPYQYSINGGISFQLSNLFDNLCPQQYTVVTMDSLGNKITDIVTIESDGTLVSYTIQVSNISAQTINAYSKTATWAVEVIPALPVGTQISFDLLVDSTHYINHPGSGTTSSINQVVKNNTIQVPYSSTTTSSTINRVDCSPYTTDIYNTKEYFSLIISYGDIITGNSTSLIAITDPQFGDNGCVTKIEQDIEISTLSPAMSGCTCCNVINNSLSKGGIQNHIVSVGSGGGDVLPPYTINIPQQPITPGSGIFLGGTIVVNTSPVTIKLKAFGGATPGGSTIGGISITGLGSFSTPTATQYNTTETSITITSSGTYYVTSMYGIFVGTSGNSVSLV